MSLPPPPRPPQQQQQQQRQEEEDKKKKKALDERDDGRGSFACQVHAIRYRNWIDLDRRSLRRPRWALSQRTGRAPFISFRLSLSLSSTHTHTPVLP